MKNEESEQEERGLRRFVALVAVAGAAAALGMMAADLPELAPAVVPTIVLGVAAAAVVWAPLRFQYRGNTQGFIFDEAVFVALLFVAPFGIGPLLLGVGIAIGHLLRRAEIEKVAYNGGQTALSAAVGTLVFYFLQPTAEVFGLSSVTAVLAATFTYNIVNTALFALLMHELAGRTFRSTLRDVWQVNAITWLGNLSAGLLLAFVTVEEPAAMVLACAPMVALYLGYRGYVGILEERSRNRQLQEVTWSLGAALGNPGAPEAFVERLARLFGGDGAELVLLEETGCQRIRYTSEDGVSRDETPLEPGEPVAEAIRRAGPVRASGVTGERGDGRRQDSLAAAALYEGRTVGALAVYERHGFEPWSDTDATLLGSLANEAALALKNVELFESVERERARLAEESKKLRDIVVAASDGIVLINPAGRIETWNPAMTDLTGVPVAEALGQPWVMPLRLRSATGREVVAGSFDPLEVALTGEQDIEPVDLQLLRRDGEWRWVRCTFSPVIHERDEGAVGVVLVARDITRDRETEDLKTDFIATVSHELRTPLTPLKGFLLTLVNAGGRFPPDKLENTYEAMLRQVDRLESLVADLLVAADLDQDRREMRLRGVDLVDAVDDVVATERPVDAPDRIRVHVANAVSVVGDRGAIMRVVRALVNNAVKHTDGAVLVRVRREGSEGIVEVVDEGPGIPPWDRERVFQRFGRLGDHLTRSTQGSGLGLSIARSLAERLGGRLDLDSDVGRGTTFLFALPLAAMRPVGERSTAVS